ncbi:acyl-CoA carboxylase subunit epsilon [Streptomyces sp. WAC05374]|uniref:acyl-CoA carboxylase subunit epsilon n=1 Tax=unclassified Streptomyces TaxID=2593676 RepID=UPI000F876B59|nr:acyl-CoA carboxylase subunit epsilon [Streptomyces sp. WAC05374]RST00237.1 acyl-CoA carboxylase subunit epsilon [Streptomyces sp. WAC05374]TDF54504.1 acyl-CoA carboxylase subunit epsilon [Streptomyces sp. WAC05374]TDF56139.1 acyl-CoA carboxylase subunit epsilon [Streptomyces sp. WAC05374]
MPFHLRIVHGRPTATELAAVTAVLTALACRTTGERPGTGTAPGRAEWDRGWRAHPAPGSWRARFGLPPRHH